MDTGTTINLDKAEHEAFWAWAAIKVLRHTGVRIEELLEITHLALVSYQLPDTGEVCADAAGRALEVQRGAPAAGKPGADERAGHHHQPPTTGQRRCGSPHRPLRRTRTSQWTTAAAPVSAQALLELGGTQSGTVQTWLNKTLARVGLTDAAGQPLRYTPHDFRRMFATEAVAGGLPVHIVARLLGHKNLNTTQAYVAVFDEELVRSYRVFLDNRRALRPEAEYREPTDLEWREFHQHFQLRKLELGECGRPYGTPCRHEHACIRCPSLRLDSRARPRLVEIIANLRDRITEANLNGWLGEATGLQTSLNEASRKLVALDRARDRHPAGPIHLGMPIITTDVPSLSSAAVSSQ